jgi:hypothetical protein
MRCCARAEANGCNVPGNADSPTLGAEALASGAAIPLLIGPGALVSIARIS